MNDSKRLFQARAHFFGAHETFLDICIRQAQFNISPQEDSQCARLENERRVAALRYAKMRSTQDPTYECAKLNKEASTACGGSPRDMYALVVHRIVWPSKQPCKTVVEMTINCALNELLRQDESAKQRS